MNLWKAFRLLGLFAGGWAGIAAASQNPSLVQWDWLACTTGILAAGFSQALIAEAPSPTIQVLATIAGFLLGWGTSAAAIGYRYVLVQFDFRELLAGLASIGLVNSSNQSVKSAYTKFTGG